ncbi:MAG: hypothetical protein MPW14_08605 [Candidatus Manganitrophus sp.]|nr:hypothetical protein [Candidatus Manganitrophus sp.]MDC4227882.1 hypothetical protein [Candidatus Manganitrophus sp.]WDT70967.1 MAG: hypothetical protein MPW17_19820 [Candidatus Manganitrophus sp.]WDT81758.1 MAG: hypothetical protein MPW14_08605 [Candidatus Manganitrophus sp.]
MKKISSRFTFYYKKVFPAIWFGFLFLFSIAALTAMLKENVFYFIELLAPIIMAVLGYFVMKILIFDHVDEVWDAGDSLVFQNGKVETRVPLSNVMNVSYTVIISPPRVTLSLREPCELGKEISFIPPMSLIPLKKSPIVIDLIDRIDAARRK